MRAVVIPPRGDRAGDGAGDGAGDDHPPAARFDERHPEPPDAEGDTLVRVRQAGVCSTDLELCRGYMGFIGVPGHEFVGTVESCPDRSRVGRRVVGEINVPCGTCRRCVGGLGNHCPHRSVLGILNHGGAFAERLRLPADNLHDLPDTLDDDAAVFVEPLAAALQVTRQVRVDETVWATVLGSGRLGLLVAQVLKGLGCPVRVLGRHPRTLGLCERWGVAARPVGEVTPRADQDLVIDCTGSPAGLTLAMRLVRPRGTIVLKSTSAAGGDVNLAPLVIDEVRLLGSRCGPFDEAIAWLAGGRIDTSSLIDRRFRLDEAVAAIEAAGRPGALKVMIRP